MANPLSMKRTIAAESGLEASGCALVANVSGVSGAAVRSKCVSGS